jgi:predicted YcjX-like family ATPase
MSNKTAVGFLTINCCIQASGGQSCPMIGEYIRSAFRDVSSYAETALNETTIRVAVTGLSRAGKTVFLTSLIHNLVALGRRLNTLPALRNHLEAAGGSRLHTIRVCSAGVEAIPHFDYAAKLALLASGTPDWPSRTEDLAQIALEVELDRVSPFWQKLGRRRVRLELLDYPGEWLLDLPLLSQTYKDWSERTLSMLRRSPRQPVCAPFLDFLTSVPPDGTADDDLVQRGVSLYAWRWRRADAWPPPPLPAARPLPLPGAAGRRAVAVVFPNRRCARLHDPFEPCRIAER